MSTDNLVVYYYGLSLHGSSLRLLSYITQSTSYSKQQVTPSNKLLQTTSYSKQQVTPNNKLLQATSYSKQQVTPNNKLLQATSYSDTPMNDLRHKFYFILKLSNVF